MNASLVKAGGVAAILTIALYTQGAVIGGAVGGVFQAFGVLPAILTLVSIKSCMNGLNYRRGDVLIWILIFIIVFIIVLAIIVGIFFSQRAQTVVAANSTILLGISGLVIAVMSLIFVLVFGLLGLRMIDFGKVAGSLWKYSGILTVIWVTWLSVLAVAVILGAALGEGQSLRSLIGHQALLIGGYAVYLVAWMTIGVALLNTAGEAAALTVESSPSGADIEESPLILDQPLARKPSPSAAGVEISAREEPKLSGKA